MTSRNGSQHDDGAFGEYSVVKAGLAFRIPNNLSDQEAAVLGLGIATVVRLKQETASAAQYATSIDPQLDAHRAKVYIRHSDCHFRRSPSLRPTFSSSTAAAPPRVSWEFSSPSCRALRS